MFDGTYVEPKYDLLLGFLWKQRLFGHVHKLSHRRLIFAADILFEYLEELLLADINLKINL